MALVLDDDQTLLRNTATDFARARLPVAKLRAMRDGNDLLGYDPEAWREMAELGWAGMLIPEELGGNGFGYLGLGLVIESLGRTLAASPVLSTVVLSGSALTLAGPNERGSAVLAQIAGGETVVAFAIDEHPVHRPRHITTRAVRCADGWRLQGRKRFVVDGHAATQLVVVARTAGGEEDADGLSMFLVDADAAGVTRRRLTLVDSRNAADLAFDNVALPADALLGAEGAAAPVIDAVLDRGRIMLAAEMHGMAQEAFDTTLGYLKQRTQFGVTIGSFQALKHRAVHMFADIELTKSVLLEALSALDDGHDDVARLASVCKARANDALQIVTNEAVQMHGGIGVTDEIDVGLYLKRARVAQALLGNTAFHRARYAECGGF